MNQITTENTEGKQTLTAQIMANVNGFATIQHKNRFNRALINAFASNDKLRECDKMSLIASATKAAQLGLEVGVEAYILPYGKTANLIVGVKGNVALLSRNKDYVIHRPVVLYENDKFEIYEELTPGGEFKRGFKITRADSSKRGNVDGGYIVWTNKDTKITEFLHMTLAQIISARKKQNIKNSNLEKHPDALVEKTLVYHLQKYLPSSAISAEEREIIIASANVMPEAGDNSIPENHFMDKKESNNRSARAKQKMNKVADGKESPPQDTNAEVVDNESTSVNTKNANI